MSADPVSRTEPTLLSVVVPVYNEGKNLSALLERLTSATAVIAGSTWEFLFVNDGSRDDSLLVLHDLARKNPAVKVIDLSRNFGKELALSAGVAHSRGDAVVCIDADLQHPPERIAELVDAWRNGAEVVIAVRRSTGKKSVLRRASSWLYNGIAARLSENKGEPRGTDFRLLDKRVRDAFLLIGERKRLFRGLVDWLGFKREYIEFDAAARFQGVPTYSVSKLWNLAIDSILSHSSVPLRLLLYCGILIATASAALLVWMFTAFHLVSERFYYTPLAQTVVFNTLLNGMVLTALGVLGLYISKIHAEVLGRPLYTVRATLNLDPDAGAARPPTLEAPSQHAPASTSRVLPNPVDDRREPAS